MADTLTRHGVPEWTSVLADVGLTWGSAAVIIGDQAAEVAAAYLRAGAPPLRFESPRFAVVAEEPIDGLDSPGPTALGLPSESFDLVVLRNAWSSLPEMTDVIWNAQRINRPGGGVIACEFDVVRALESPAVRYPSQLFYAAHPEVVEYFTSVAVGTVDIAVEMGRAGYFDVRRGDVVETRGSFTDAEAMFSFVAAHGWRGMERLEPAAAVAVLDQLAAVLPDLAPRGEIADREPWICVRGTKRS